MVGTQGFLVIQKCDIGLEELCTGQRGYLDQIRFLSSLRSWFCSLRCIIFLLFYEHQSRKSKFKHNCVAITLYVLY